MNGFIHGETLGRLNRFSQSSKGLYHMDYSLSKTSLPLEQAVGGEAAMSH